jgi:hypothetical protein
VPLDPPKARAFTELACLTISNWECSLSAMMYSASNFPSAISFESDHVHVRQADPLRDGLAAV